MNFEYFIAKQIAPGKSDNYAKPVVKISYISIALGLALMIISVSVVIGFKRSVSNKIVGFTSQLQITPFDNNESMEERPLTVGPELIEKLASSKHITHIQLTAKKAAVLKTDDQIQGIVFKGVGVDYDTGFLSGSLVKGSLPSFGVFSQTNEVLISETLSKKLNVDVGDDLRTWFVSGDYSRARGRKFTISGLYNTSLEEFDNLFVIGDLKHIQKLNGWENDQVGTIEVMVDQKEGLRDIAFELYRILPYDLRISTVMDQYPQIYNWLELLDVNVIVILVLMVVVAAITMISTLLILIMERTNMVGVLKALGASNKSIIKIFLYKAIYIVFRGMIWGNLLGLSFYFIQYYFRIVKLSPENYYVDYVPVELSPLLFLALNAGTFIVCFLMLIGPSIYITRIIPSRALRYE